MEGSLSGVHGSMRVLAVTLCISASPVLFAAGLEAGARLGSYPPKHLSGPDKGTRQCPPCKYAGGPFVQIFINDESDANTKSLAQRLESALAGNEKWHGVVVMMDETRKAEFEKWAGEWKLEKAALCYVLTGNRGTVVRDYKLDGTKNVVVVSNEKKVLQSFENASIDDLEKALKLIKN